MADAVIRLSLDDSQLRAGAARASRSLRNIARSAERLQAVGLRVGRSFAESITRGVTGGAGQTLAATDNLMRQTAARVTGARGLNAAGRSIPRQIAAGVRAGAPTLTSAVTRMTADATRRVSQSTASPIGARMAGLQGIGAGPTAPLPIGTRFAGLQRAGNVLQRPTAFAPAPPRPPLPIPAAPAADPPRGTRAGAATARTGGQAARRRHRRRARGRHGEVVGLPDARQHRAPRLLTAIGRGLLIRRSACRIGTCRRHRLSLRTVLPESLVDRAGLLMTARPRDMRSGAPRRAGLRRCPKPSFSVQAAFVGLASCVSTPHQTMQAV